MTEADDAAVRRIARDVQKTRSETREQARASQGSFRSVQLTDGPVSYYDEDGVERLRLGAFGEDGEFTVMEVNSPPPPVPTAPDTVAWPSSIGVYWDGTFEGANSPLDLARVEIHASQDGAAFVADDNTQVGDFTSRTGGVFNFPCEPVQGVFWFKLVAVNNAGIESEASVADSNTALTITETTDGAVPPQVTGLTVEGGIRSLFLRWNSVTNADPVEYLVYAGTNSGFTVNATHLVGTAGANRLSVNKVYNDTLAIMEDVAPGINYYFKVVAKDFDGPGTASTEAVGSPVQITGPDIAAGSVTTEKLLANSVTADKLEAVLALVSALQVGDNISLRPTDSAPGAMDSGLRINLTNGGYIWLPADGSGAQFNRVSARFTDAVVEGNMQILGSTNRVGGSLTLDASVPPPAVAPVVSSVFDPAPMQAPGFGNGYYGTFAGLGYDATYWYTAQYNGYFYPYPEGGGTPDQGLDFYCYRTHRVTGVTTVYWEYHDFPFTDDGGYISGYSHSTSHDVVTVAFDGSEKFSEIWIRNNTTTGMTRNVWSRSGSFKWPAIFTNGTNIWIAACSKSTKRISVYRYDMAMGSEALLFTSAPGMEPDANLFSLYVGAADFGATHYIIGSSNSIYVFDNLFTRQTSKEFARSNGETLRGMNYDGSRLYSFHSTGKVRKYSSLQTTTARVAKYTWTNPSGPTESTASPANASVNQLLRQFMKITTSAIPSTGDPTGPTAVQLYVANQKQAVTASGVTTVTLEAPTTGGSNSPGSDGFAALGLNGSVTSEAQFSAGVPKIRFKGDGIGNVGKFAVDTNGNATKLFYNEYWQAAGPFSPTGTANVTLTGVGGNLSVEATTDVHVVRFDCNVAYGNTDVTNVVELLVDGVVYGDNINNTMPTSVAGSGFRVQSSKQWVLTGLAAGTRVISMRTRNNLASRTVALRDCTLTTVRMR